MEKTIAKIQNIDFQKLEESFSKLSKEAFKLNSEPVICQAIKDTKIFEVGQWTDEIVNRKGYEIFKQLYTRFYNNGRKFNVIFYNDNWVVISLPNRTELLPKESITLEAVIDYDKIAVSEIKTKLLGNSSSADLSIQGESVSLEEKRDKLDLLNQDLEEEKNKITQKMWELEEQMRKELARAREELEKRKNELEIKKKEMEKEVFNLENEIYSLRCLLGDNFDLIQLRKGKEAKSESPVVLFQKLRYLDEDLAKMEKLQNIDIENWKSIEACLSKRDDVFEIFCPCDKCIVLLKASKNGVFFVQQPDSMLEWVKYENGNQIAILIRNGENLWIAWTDEKILIDENLIISNETKQIELDEDSIQTKETIDVKADYTKDHGWAQYFSRKFIFQILQGLIQYKKILKFPEEINMFYKSPYIVYSMADNQLVDTRYKSLSEYLNWANSLTEQGDHILPMKTIYGCFTEKSMWGNQYIENHSRGRGERNRVRDADIPKEVVTINYVEHPSEGVWLQRFSNEDKQKAIQDNDNESLERMKEFEYAEELLEKAGSNQVSIDNITYEWEKIAARRGYVWKESHQKYRISKKYIKKTVYDFSKKRYYVSCLKDYSNSGKARANVRIYPDEFINLEFCTSRIMRNWLQNQQVGDGIEGDYAYIISYLRKAIDYLEDREKQNFKLIQSFISDYDLTTIENFDLIELTYKIEHNIKKWTKRTIKKFLTYLMCDVGETDESLFIKKLPWIK